MAYRYFCEKSESIGGLVVLGQTFADPFIGFWDASLNNYRGGVPTRPANNNFYSCSPNDKSTPFLGVIGDMDFYYSDRFGVDGLRAMQQWREEFSRDVLQCTDTTTTTIADSSNNITFREYPISQCEQYNHCANNNVIDDDNSINIMCQVEGLGHDSSILGELLTTAFDEFFTNGDNNNKKNGNNDYYYNFENNNDNALYEASICDSSGARTTEYYGYRRN